MTDWKIGGSSAAAILGVDHYTTPLKLYAKLLGILPEEPDSEAAYWGRQLEDRVLQRYTRDTGLHVVTASMLGDVDSFQVIAPDGKRWHVRRGGAEPFQEAIGLLSVVHPDRPWQVGHLDGIAGTYGGGAFHVDRMVEVKTASEWLRREWGEPGTDEIPDGYIPQPQHYLDILHALGWELDADVCVLIGGQRFGLYHMARDAEYGAMLAEREAAFIQRLEDRDPPVAMAGDVATLVHLFPDSVPDNILQVERGGYAEGLARDYARLSAEMKAGKERRDGVQARLFQHMGAAEEMVGADGWSIKWRAPNANPRTDWEAAFHQLRNALALRIPGELSGTDFARLVREARDENTATPELSRRMYHSKLERLLDG